MINHADTLIWVDGRFERTRTFPYPIGEIVFTISPQALKCFAFQKGGNMNIQKFTQKSIEAINQCEKLAYEYGNQQIEQEHLLYSLLTLEDSLILKLIEKMGIDPESFKNRALACVEGLTKVHGGDSRVYVSGEMNKALLGAETEAKSRIKKAIEYIRENMDEDDMAILKASMNKCYKQHLIPDEDVMDCDRVIELLDEYGEENELDERWWEEDTELSDILAEL